MAQPRRKKLDLLRSGKGETRYLEIKKSLSDELRRRRAAKHLTQAEVARALATSQSRFARSIHITATTGRSSDSEPIEKVRHRLEAHRGKRVANVTREPDRAARYSGVRRA